MDNSKLIALIEKVTEHVLAELKERCVTYRPDMSSPEEYSVITALLSRQATLATELASSPQLWNGHSSPLFLRAMADVHISLVWIMASPKERALKFVEYGLGQVVLQMEHRKVEMKTCSADLKESLAMMNDHDQKWIDFQKYSFMVDVNVGAWSGKSTREMAEEAGCLDFYNFVFSPFSQCVHSTWGHLGKYNSSPDESPMTGHLWIPIIRPRDPDFNELQLTLKYVDKSFNAFDETILKREPKSNTRGCLREVMKSIKDEGS